MEFTDFIVIPVLLFLIYFFAYYWKSKYARGKSGYQFFIPALTVKLLAGVCFGIMYTTYYSWGSDSHAYFKGVEVMHQSAEYAWWLPFKILFSNANTYIPEATKYTNLFYYSGKDTFMVIRFAFIASFFAAKSYFGITILFSVFSFTGLWKLYRAFITQYPKVQKQLAIVVLFIPTVAFFGSGIMKDTIVIGCLGWLFWATINLIQYRKHLILNIIIIGISSYLILTIKAYVLLAFIPGVGLFYFVQSIAKIKNVKLKMVVLPVSLLTIGLIGVGVVLLIGNYLSRYNISNVLSSIEGMQYYQAVLSDREGGSSGYNLGEFEATWLGFIKFVPKAINVALFRPYIWEANSPLMLFTAIETLAFVIGTIYTVARLRLLNIIRLLSKSYVLLSLTFVLILAIATGLVSYNFGALARYRIPLVPFFGATLVIMNFYANNSKKEASTAILE